MGSKGLGTFALLRGASAFVNLTFTLLCLCLRLSMFGLWFGCCFGLRRSLVNVGGLGSLRFGEDWKACIDRDRWDGLHITLELKYMAYIRTFTIELSKRTLVPIAKNIGYMCLGSVATIFGLAYRPWDLRLSYY